MHWKIWLIDDLNEHQPTSLQTTGHIFAWCVSCHVVQLLRLYKVFNDDTWTKLSVTTRSVIWIWFALLTDIFIYKTTSCKYFVMRCALYFLFLNIYCLYILLGHKLVNMFVMRRQAFMANTICGLCCNRIYFSTNVFAQMFFFKCFVWRISNTSLHCIVGVFYCYINISDIVSFTEYFPIVTCRLVNMKLKIGTCLMVQETINEPSSALLSYKGSTTSLQRIEKMSMLSGLSMECSATNKAAPLILKWVQCVNRESREECDV